MINSCNTTSQDWFNHIAQNLTSNALIQYILRTEDTVDYQLLQKSVLLSIQAEPILGCLFVEDEKMPLWKPVAINAEDVCCLIKTKAIEDDISSVLETELDVSRQLPVKVCLLDGEKSNAIVIKINHSVCDGSGSKYFVKLLADIYTQLEKDNSFVPVKNVPVRDTRNFYDILKIEDKASYFKPEKAELISTWGFPASGEMIKQQIFSYRQLRYTDNDFQRIKQFTEKQKITLNTLLTAAYFSALLKVLKPTGTTKELQFMIDLRRYLSSEVTQNICNLSAILNVELPVKMTDFMELLKQTDTAINEITKADNFIHGTIAGDLAEESGYEAVKDFIKSDWENILKTGNCTPMISNLGMFGSETIYFGRVEVQDLCLISPAFFSPAFMIGIMTYNNVLTINASYYSPGINHDEIKDLLKQIDCQIKNIMH